MKKEMSIALALTMMLSTSYITANASGSSVETEVRSVEISSDTATLRVDQSRTLFAYVVPSDADDQDITWVSSDSEVAVVEEGVVYGISPGQATITACSWDGRRSASCEVTVLDTVLGSGIKDFDIRQHPYAAMDGGEILYAATLRTDANEALKSSSSALLTYKNKTKVSAAALRSADYAARSAEKQLTLRFDTKGADSSVQGRLEVDSSQLRALQTDLNPAVYTEGEKLTTWTKEAAEAAGSKTAVISCGQSGSYGMMVKIAAKLDGFSAADEISLYRYLPEQQKLVPLETQARVDGNGYLHFETDTGGVYAVVSGR